MRSLTKEEFNSVQSFLENNIQSFFSTKVCSDKKVIENDIEISNNEIRIVKENCIFTQRLLDIELLRDEIAHISYSEKNPFYSWDVDYSILEIDSTQNAKFWKNGKQKIQYPYFSFIIVIALTLTGKLLSIGELFDLYTAVFMDVVPIDDRMPDEERCVHYATDLKIPYNTSYCDRINIDRMIPSATFEGRRYRNITLKFKQQYFENNTLGLPFNEITAEQLLYSICKMYYPFLRNVDAILHFVHKEMEIFYSAKFDAYYHIDGILEGIPFYSLTRFDKTCFFSEVDLSARYPIINKKQCFRIDKTAQLNSKTIPLYDEKVIDEIIDAVINGAMKGFQKFVD